MIHTPEKSGLPLLVRGAGAVKSGLPGGSRGTPGRRIMQPLREERQIRRQQESGTRQSACHGCIFSGLAAERQAHETGRSNYPLRRAGVRCYYPRNSYN